MHRCLQIQELLSIIFQNVCIQGTLARLARTCTDFRDPALNVLWHTQNTFLPLFECLPRDAWVIKKKKFVSNNLEIKNYPSLNMFVIQCISRKLTASDFGRIYFYSHRIKVFCQRSHSVDLEDQVLAIIWSRKPSPGPLLCNVLEAEIDGNSFNGLAIQARLIIGPCIRKIQVHVLEESFTWSNIIATLRKAAPLDLSSFMLLGGLRNLPCLESESLELLSTFRSVRTLAITEIFLTSHAINMIGTLPALEDLRLSITEQLMQHYNPSDGNNFPLLTHLEICSETTNACRLLLLKIQSKTLRSLKVRRTGIAHWAVRRLFVALHASNLASRLETLILYNSLGHTFEINAYTVERLDSFKHLRELSIYPTCVDLDDNHLMQLAKALPHLRLLSFNKPYNPRIIPKCTFIGLQHLVQFCPKLERLTLCIDARQIPIFSTQPDGEYLLGLHLTTLNLCTAPVLNACDVASYLITLFPALTNFSTDYDCIEDDDDSIVNRYCIIWSKVQELLEHVI